MKLSQVLEAKYYQGRISANRVANLYWDVFNHKQDDNNFIKFHTPRLYGSVNRSATSTQIDAFLGAKDSSQARRLVKDYIQKLNLPYTSLSVEHGDTRNDRIPRTPDDYVVTITFNEDD